MTRLPLLILTCMIAARITSAEEPKATPIQDTCSQRKAETVKIPLKNIWGHDLKLRDLEPERHLNLDTTEKIAKYADPKVLKSARAALKPSLAIAIEKAMNADALSSPNRNRKGTAIPHPGFAVSGENREALEHAYQVVVEREKPAQLFRESEAVTIVFFSLQSGLYVDLVSATREASNVRVEYALVPIAQKSVQWKFAMIPLGKLAAGKYDVTFSRIRNQNPKLNLSKAPEVAQGLEAEIVCRPFTFSVVKK